MNQNLKEKLDEIASNVIVCIHRLLLDGCIIESILEAYREFCRSDNAQNLNIVEIPSDDEIRLTLRFECMCYTAFIATLLPKYFKKNKFFSNEPYERLVELFQFAIATALIEYCNKSGMSKLREATLIAIDPKPLFGFGEYLNPLNRLEEYGLAIQNKQGDELKRFGKWIGKTIDAPNYHIFEIIGGSFGSDVFPHLADSAMAIVIPSE